MCTLCLSFCSVDLSCGMVSLYLYAMINITLSSQNVENQRQTKHKTEDLAFRTSYIFFARREEYVSHGQYGGHHEYFRWIEFVDREEQPSYHPQSMMRKQRDRRGSVTAVLSCKY